MIYFNRFFLIESLPGSERKTGKELYDDCLSIVLDKGKGIKVDYITITNKSELTNILGEIFKETENGCIPIIHFEMHGYIVNEKLEFGFILSSGEKVKIEEIKQILIRVLSRKFMI